MMTFSFLQLFLNCKFFAFLSDMTDILLVVVFPFELTIGFSVRE